MTFRDTDHEYFAETEGPPKPRADKGSHNPKRSTHNSRCATRSKGFPWTDERFKLAADMWAMGHSARDVADALTRKYGRTCTRFAVIGKMHRHHIQQGVGVRLPEIHEPEPKPAPVVVYLPRPDLGPRQCRWSSADEPICREGVCGKPATAQANAHRYCAEHDQRRIAESREAE